VAICVIRGVVEVSRDTGLATEVELDVHEVKGRPSVASVWLNSAGRRR
jgi:hypothetical protein